MVIIPHRKPFVLLAVLALAALFQGCSSVDVRPSGPYRSLKVAEGVEGVPGTVSWSPDGMRLAFLKKGEAYVHDIASSGTKAPGLEHMSYLVWLDSGELAGLRKAGEGELPVLTLLDVRTREKKDFPLPVGTIAVYPTWNPQCLLALTSVRKVMRIGVEDRYEMYCVDRHGAASGKKYEAGRIVPGGLSDMGAFRGWMSGGVSIISGEVMLFRLINPPALPPYIKVVSVNVITGQDREIARLRTEFPEVWGSWDPLGVRVALPDDMGYLRVLSLDGGYERLNTSIEGRYPSWDPRDGQIFFGGHLVREDGSEPVALFPDRAESAAFFSPRGDRLAVTADGTLWLLEGVEAAPEALNMDMEELKKQVAMLAELYREGLITAEDLAERLSVLTRPAGAQNEIP